MRIEMMFLILVGALYVGLLVVPGILAMTNWRKLAVTYGTSVDASESAPVARVLTSPGLYVKAWCRVERREEGLLFAPIAQFKLTQGAVLVPWSDIRATRGRAMFQPAAVIRFARVDGVVVRIGGQVGETILAQVGTPGAA